MNDLSNILTLKSILSQYGFKFSKSLGQNFLTDNQVCSRMAEASIDNSNYGVIEIGPGVGILTVELAKRAKKVVSIELDKRLLPILENTLKDFNNIKVINDDIMKIDLKKLIVDEFALMPVCICANLPYYITSPVIMKILENRLPISNITVMIQKEAANRICALPGTRQVGAISFAVRYYSEPKMLFDILRNSFVPEPNVDSCSIKLSIREKPSVDVNCEKTFFRIIKCLFAQRRKMIVNPLSTNLHIPKNEIKSILNSIGILENARPEELTMEDIAKISNSL